MHNKSIHWLDPDTKIWGFHCHQELPEDQFAGALIVQKQLAEYLANHGVTIDADDAVRPGYGPHLNHMWELRVESAQSNPLGKLGLAISYLSVNRSGMSAYIHPLMHDPGATDDLKNEGLYNQPNALWFSHKVPQNQEFFFNPPLDESGQILDTRTSRVMSRCQKLAISRKAGHLSFVDPSEVITNGYHIHMDFEESDRQLAITIFEQFLNYLQVKELNPDTTRIYGPGENGPHQSAGWEAKFKDGKRMLTDIGLVVGWLMCNRQNLPVFIHPETWRAGDVAEELKAHEQYSSFLGELPALDLSFFANQLLPNSTETRECNASRSP